MPENQSAYVELEQAVHAAYREATPKSRDWHERASRSLVGGVSGTVRYFPPYPLYFDGGEGSRQTDIDGNTYIDCFLCGACLLLGHRHPAITAAMTARADSGSLILNPRLSTEVAEALQQMVPAAERVRLLNSGTEAVMSALRFARAFTGHPKIVKFFGTYHGQSDQVLVGLGRREHRLGAGITEAAVSQMVMARFGDHEGLKDVLRGGDIAAVLVDPSMHHEGLWAGTADDYRAIQQTAADAGSLLIFDEVISGFRLAAGGAQEYFGVVPDLAVYGKAFGLGEKIGAVVGRADVMAVADPSPGRSAGPFAFQSGTGNDSTGALTAALAGMSAYRQLGDTGGYPALDGLASQLGHGLRDAFAAHGIACHFNQLGPMVRLFLTDGPPDFEHCTSLDRRPVNLFHLALLTEGVLTIPGSNDFFLSFAHTESDIAEIIAAARRVLDRFDFPSAVGQLSVSARR
jgi:glutamate-1-semialdehyde 2,1-aminomutase